VLRPPAKADRPAHLEEIRSADLAAERALLAEAARRARRHGAARLALTSLPPHGALATATALGQVEINTGGGMMLRNVGLDDAEYREVVRLYGSGESVWWEADGF